MRCGVRLHVPPARARLPACLTIPNGACDFRSGAVSSRVRPPFSESRLCNRRKSNPSRTRGTAGPGARAWPAAAQTGNQSKPNCNCLRTYSLNYHLPYFTSWSSFETLDDNTFMSISARRTFGIILVIISVVAFVTYVIFDMLHADWRYVSSDSSGTGTAILFSAHSTISGYGYYLIPIFLCEAFGIFCLVWPARKPPKLNQ